ncbi:hypothetical protein HK096_000661, partial [Nowakowskiella sp. JEL0078]
VNTAASSSSLESRISEWVNREVMMRVLARPTVVLPESTQVPITENKGISTDPEFIQALRKVDLVDKSTSVCESNNPETIDLIFDMIASNFLEAFIPPLVYDAISQEHENKIRILQSQRDKIQQVTLLENLDLNSLETNKQVSTSETDQDAKVLEDMTTRLSKIFEVRQQQFLVELKQRDEQRQKMDSEFLNTVFSLNALNERLTRERDLLDQRFDEMKKEVDEQLRIEIDSRNHQEDLVLIKTITPEVIEQISKHSDLGIIK